MQLKTFIIVFHIIIFTLGSTYKKVIPNLDPKAVCLDGSPGILYVNQGTEKDKYIIYAFGGGVCGEQTLSDSLQSCYKRSKSFFGSSTLWPQIVPLQQGIFSGKAQKSKFANWTKFLFAYCDGALHQGYRNQPISYKDTKLYFRGSAITRQNFKWIDQNYNLSKASKIVLTGSSAGGTMAFLWSEYLVNLVKNRTIVETVVDSGLFVNATTMTNPRNLMQIVSQNIYKIANIDQKTPNTQCSLKYAGGQQWKCLFLIYAFTSVPGRLLVIDSQYDSFQVQEFVQARCVIDRQSGGQTLKDCTTTQLQAIQKNRKLRQQAYYSLMLFQKNSLWAIACSNHMYLMQDRLYSSNEQRVPMNTQYSARATIEAFVFDQARIQQVDNITWPNNKPCAY